MTTNAGGRERAAELAILRRVRFALLSPGENHGQ